MTSPAPFLSRQLGDYLLVAQLSEDALGTVYRALCAADERRFVRLRLLQSQELSREALERAVAANAGWGSALAHDAIVPRAQLDTVEGIPFLTWDETAGWTLDTMLARVRAYGIRIPAEYALLIAERIAEALEHAHRTLVDGKPAHHGILWPGFVSISHDAAVRVGGFGLAVGVLPTLAAPRLTSEIAPYVAPEARAFGEAGANSDVYSLGAILIELVTGRQPSLEMPSGELRAGDPRSEELERFLRRCLAPPEERFASAAEAHRAVQQLVTGNPFSLYTANLALFLYKLLNPESQSVAPSSDFESTNPVVLQGPILRAPAESPPPLPPPGTPRRPHGDPPEEEIPEAREALPAEAMEEAAPLAASARLEESGASLSEARLRSLPALPLFARAWARPAVALAAAAAVAVGAFLVVSQIQTTRREAASSRAALVEAPGAVPFALPPAASPAEPQAQRPQAVRQVSSPAAGPAPVRASRKPPPRRRPAEDERLRAALARLEADRVNARETAGEIFGEGRLSEEEGERLLREREYDAAQLAFSRAARLFQQAQELTWEERIRRADLAPAR